MIEGVQPSELGAQPVGEAARVAEDVYGLKLPVPLPLRFVSVYLVEGDDGWTLVDAGYDYPLTYEAWERGAAAVGCGLDREVSRILVTHFHPDHLGGARWLQERSGAPVFMLDEEIPFARELWSRPEAASPFLEHLVRYGMPREMAESAAAAMRPGLPLPEEMSPLSPGEKLPLGVSSARVIHAPGHVHPRVSGGSQAPHHQRVLHRRVEVVRGEHNPLDERPGRVDVDRCDLYSVEVHGRLALPLRPRRGRLSRRNRSSPRRLCRRLGRGCPVVAGKRRSIVCAPPMDCSRAYRTAVAAAAACSFSARSA